MKRITPFVTGLWVVVAWMFSLSWQFNIGIGLGASYWYWLLFSPYFIIAWLSSIFIGACWAFERWTENKSTAMYWLFLLLPACPCLVEIAIPIWGLWLIWQGIRGPPVQESDDIKRFRSSY